MRLVTSLNYVKDFLKDAGGSGDHSSPLDDPDNPIHPVFAPKHWCYKTPGSTSHTRLSDIAYEAIAPALRLASLPITEPRMLAPFDHIANGMIVNVKNGVPYIAKGSLEGTSLGHAHVKAIFDYMAASNTLFTFAARRDDINLAGTVTLYHHDHGGNKSKDLTTTTGNTGKLRRKF